MPDDFATVDGPLAPALALQVNEVCDRFEAAWKATGPGAPGPRIEDYVPGRPERAPAVLLHYLIKLEIDYRRLRGEAPSAGEYEPRFPALSGRFLAQAMAKAPSAGLADRPMAPPPAAEEEADPLVDAETTVLPRSFQPKLRSDRYVIQQFHARGGMGEVWLADDTDVGRQVALKRLRKKREDEHDRFLIEAQITGQLVHPGIVPVHDLGLDKDGRPFYVMSFIHGRTLKTVIEEYHAGRAANGVPREVQGAGLLDIFVKVCQAVAYAHHRGVIHRDLKPDNVMLGPFGETLVLDWGMAKLRGQPEPAGDVLPVRLTYSGGSTATQFGVIMGSPAYMAPEVADGRAAEADERTDVYLLGGTLYHLLTGQLPRHGSSAEEIVQLARSVPPPPPRRLRADIPRALEAICVKAMAHRPQDRYGSALQLAEDVQRYLAGAPVSAYREPLLARGWRWCKRHRRGLGRGLAAACVLSLALFGTVELRDAWNQAEAARREADELQRCEQARRDLERFRRLADECRFYTPNSTPAAQLATYFKACQGQIAGQQLLQAAERLASEMEALPLPAEWAALKGEWHDLLLVRAQAQIQHGGDRSAVPEILERVERAASLQGASRGVHRLRACCYRTRGEEKRAAEEELRAEAARATALDHFLEAEADRTRAFDPPRSSADDLAWQPNAALREAIAHYQQALHLEPDNFWCHLQMGRCYLTLGQGAEAVEALGTCVALRPKAPWGYSARGLTLGLLQRYADGEADLERALALDPEFRPALLHRGILARRQRQDERALADFARVLEPPNDRRLLEAAYYRGQLHLQRKEHPEARRDFDLVARENPSFRPLYLSRAQLHFLRGDDARGMADLTTFLDLGSAKPFDPRDPRLYAQRGRLLQQLVPNWGLPREEAQARMRRAREELEKARTLGHRSAELFHALGTVAYWLGRWGDKQEWQQALAAYQQALETAPPALAVKVYTTRGWIYAQFLDPPQPDAARQEFAEAVRLDPTHADAHAGLGYVQALQKSPGGAQRAAAQALWHGAGDYLILHNVACIYAELSRTDAAQAAQHQDLALALLQRAVVLCRRVGEGNKEISYLVNDPALRVLHGRPEWQKLVK